MHIVDIITLAGFALSFVIWFSVSGARRRLLLTAALLITMQVAGHFLDSARYLDALWIVWAVVLFLLQLVGVAIAAGLGTFARRVRTRRSQ